MVSTQNNTVRRSKVDITGVPETMLQTLYARAKESRKPDHAIYDGKAIEIVDSLDYDFSLADKDMAMGSGVIARTIVLDKLVSEYLKKHKGAVVVNIACGLDTRCYRNEGKYKGWYNIDPGDHDCKGKVPAGGRTGVPDSGIRHGRQMG